MNTTKVFDRIEAPNPDARTTMLCSRDRSVSMLNMTISYLSGIEKL